MEQLTTKLASVDSCEDCCGNRSSSQWKRVFVYFVEGCERRELDANKIIKYFFENNYKIVSKPEHADLIILVTCGAVDETTKQSLNKVKEFQKHNAELIVTGCLPVIEKEKISKIFDGTVINIKNLDRIDTIFPENKIKWKNITDSHAKFQNLNEDRFLRNLTRVSKTPNLFSKLCVGIGEQVLKSRYNQNSYKYRLHSLKNPTHIIRVSHGCLGQCSYCAIRKAIGTMKSKPIELCIQEFKKGLAAGYKRFLISGDEVGAYGLDIGSSFPELLDKLTQNQGNYELFIQCISPRWIIKYVNELERILKRQKIKYMEIPIQTSSSRLLKLMHRFMDPKRIKEAILRLKSAHPELVLNTNCIVGFPTETDEEYKNTLDFTTELDFDGCISSFSCKVGTEAEKITPKVPETEIRRRLEYTKKILEQAGYAVQLYLSKGLVTFEKRSHWVGRHTPNEAYISLINKETER